MPITYPRNTQSNYVLFDTTQNRPAKEITSYPRADGGRVVNLDPNLIYLEIVQEALPNFDGLRETIEPVTFNDLDNGTHTRSWKIVPLPIEQATEQYNFAVEAEANRRVLNIASETKQMQMLARGLILVNKSAKGQAHNQQEKGEVEKLEATWQVITAVRAAAEQIKIDRPADIPNSTLWP